MEKYLFSMGMINGMKLKNRLVMSAMTTGFSENGHLSQRDYEFYKARAKGGASAIVVPVKIGKEAGSQQMYTLESDEYILEYQKLADILHEYDCKLIYQLFHWGWKNQQDAKLQTNPIDGNAVSALTIEELIERRKQFILAAERAKKAGADGIEINCGDGYYLSQFLSPLSNKRADEYGGEEENRMKMPIEVIKAVRSKLGKDFPLWVRISGAELITGGYDIEFTIRFCQRLEEEEIADAFEITPGWNQKEIPTTFYQVPDGGYSFMADAIKRFTNVPVIASIGGTKIKTAEKMLERGICDWIGTARGFLADPEIAEKVKADKSYNVCQRCNACIESMLQGGEAVCAYNPEAGKEFLEIKHRPIATAKKVLVIGGGPAGMMAAKKAAQRGFKTTLCLKENKLGGNLNLAALAPGKQDILLFIENLRQELESLRVEIRYQTEVDGKYAVDFQPYFVVVAVGSVPASLKIPGIEMEHVIQANDVFAGDRLVWEKLKKGKTVVIGGGSAGLEVAAFLADKTMTDEKSLHFLRNYKNSEFYKLYQPLEITVLEKGEKIGADLGSSGWIMERELKEYGVQWLVNTKVKEIKKGAVLAELNHGIIKVKADHVILALGEEPGDSSLTTELENERISFAKIGDADQIGGAFYALHSAFELFLRVYLA